MQLNNNNYQRGAKLITYFSRIFSSALKNFNETEIEQLMLEWGDTIEDLTDEQVRLGCKRTKYEENYLPAHKRFRFLSFGLIDPDRAYQVALERKYPHVAIYLAAQACSLHSAHYRPSNDQMFTKFRRVYCNYCDEVTSGIKLEMPVAFIEYKKQAQTYEEYCKSMEAKFGKEYKQRAEMKYQDYKNSSDKKQYIEETIKNMKSFLKNTKKDI